MTFGQYVMKMIGHVSLHVMIASIFVALMVLCCIAFVLLVWRDDDIEISFFVVGYIFCMIGTGVAGWILPLHVMQMVLSFEFLGLFWLWACC